ncbi:hypothetical protein [Pseudomonas sp. MYb118]|uniref:hypothetical protein n=1 Tax=Pseudomonas sp. MYb118 TaxID=1848720 RepID=UPI0034CE6E72
MGGDWQFSDIASSDVMVTETPQAAKQPSSSFTSIASKLAPTGTVVFMRSADGADPL